MPEHALIVYLKLSDEGFGSESEQKDLFELQDRLTEAVESSGADEFDGNEFGGGFCTFYMYGPDADKIEAKVLPIIREFKPRKGSYFRKRYGDVDDSNAKEVDVQL